MNQFFYQHKFVQDIACSQGLIRIWSAEGGPDRDQLNRLFSPYFKTGQVYPYIALLPDFHAGDPARVGSVIPTTGAVFPDLVGDDLGCGMSAMPLPYTADSVARNADGILAAIMKAIPAGTGQYTQPSEEALRDPVWSLELKGPGILARTRRKLRHQFGTLGGGNHFLELQKDAAGELWLMLHTGARYLGAVLRDWYHELALKRQGDSSSGQMVYLPAGSKEAEDYLHDAGAVMRFAAASRAFILRRTAAILRDSAVLESSAEQDAVSTIIDMPHNTVTRELHFGEQLIIHRKGAQALNCGQKGLLPGSMGTMSCIVNGMGNAFSFHSASHGAGRRLTRRDARRQVTEAQFKRSMHGVTYPSNRNLVEEAPDAYKDIRLVIRGQHDLLKVVRQLHPLLVVKG